MIIKKYLNETEWLEDRKGRITGSRLGSLFSKRDKKPLKGFYELIAERVAIPADGENVMDRGKRLEVEGIERFEAETKKVVNKDLVLWTRDDDENIAVSPDGYIGETEAVEVKCLNSASHIEAFLTGEIPSEYEYQVLQYFIVNDSLATLYFCFFDPRMPKDFFFHKVERVSVAEKIAEYLEIEREALLKIKEIEDKLTF